jgi:hypothetical protein
VIESLRRRAGRFGLDIILVDVWEGTGAAQEAADYCLRWSLEGVVVLDETAEYARALGIRGVPTNVFVDDSGVVQAVGASTFDALLAEASRLEPRLADDTDVAGAERKPSDFE